MTRPLSHDSLGRRHQHVARRTGNEERKPNLRGFKVYVGTFVAAGDPGNDPPDTSPSSPAWQNGFTYKGGAPVWFAHGLDGETDMGGEYDLITGSPVSGDIAFTMPAEWVAGMPRAAAIPVELDTDVWGFAMQVCDLTTGDVRLFWPTVATAYP